jgi:hypothetical protein
VYEGNQAGGEGKVYCWYDSNLMSWAFSPNENDIDTSVWHLYVASYAICPELIERISTEWKAIVAGKHFPQPIEVHTLTAEQVPLEQEQLRPQVR